MSRNTRSARSFKLRVTHCSYWRNINNWDVAKKLSVSDVQQKCKPAFNECKSEYTHTE